MTQASGVFPTYPLVSGMWVMGLFAGFVGTGTPRDHVGL